MTDSPAPAALFWDFDGVLIDSNGVRDEGFLRVLAGYPEGQLEQFMDFHRENGGLSRFVKFRYFFEELRKEPVSEAQIYELHLAFTAIMRELLADPARLIEPTVEYLRTHGARQPMHVVSGSEEGELRDLCQRLGLTPYFRSIHGSPAGKAEIIGGLLEAHGYPPEQCIMIGDAINDVHGAVATGIGFQAYNAPHLAHHNRGLQIPLREFGRGQ
jgi:phosphoglycolate phosphatase-like HAD superfamily hydrolase